MRCNNELPEEFTKTLMEIAAKCIEGNTDSCQLELEVKERIIIVEISFHSFHKWDIHA